MGKKALTVGQIVVALLIPLVFPVAGYTQEPITNVMGPYEFNPVQNGGYSRWNVELYTFFKSGRWLLPKSEESRWGRSQRIMA